jgi:two-component system, NarL family, sensor histidine kinase UhpB
MQTAGEDRALLDALLEHARHSLGADHVTFCAWDEADRTLTVEHATGRLDHPEVLATGEPISIPAEGLDEDPYQPGRDHPVVYRAEPGERPGVLEFLRRIGAHSEITIPVFDRPGGKWALEAFFCDPARELGERELGTAAKLAPLAAAALGRDALLADLRAAEARFRSVVEQLPAITFVDTLDGTAIYTSPQIESLLGYTVDQWQAPGFWQECVVEDDRERVRAAYAALTATGRVDVEYRMTAADGGIVSFNERAKLVPDAAGGEPTVHGVMIDITAREQAEAALRESEARRERVLEEMLRAEEAERARIATELHDDTIQVMAAALIAIDRVTAALGDVRAPREAESLRAARAILQQAVDRTRRMTFELRPPLLEANGIEPALRDLAEEAGRESGFTVALDLRVARYPFAIEDLVYRTVQESLANARKHAAARHVEITVAENADDLAGVIRDDGRGFDVRTALDRSRMRMHIGLDAMRERVHLAGGTLEIRSAPGGGTTVEFAIPLPRPA